MGLAYHGRFYTVFLSEVGVMALAVEKILSEKMKSPIIKIYSNCQSAISAIPSSHSNSKTVHYCWSLLHRLDDICKWSISWVKAHVGNNGNEAADKLAKQGTSTFPSNCSHMHQKCLGKIFIHELGNLLEWKN
jgi:hypothetical protein